MLKPLLTRLLNHLVNQNSWAKTQLQGYGGKTVRFDMPPLGATLTVLEDGGLAIAGESATADARIIMPVPAALRLLTGDEGASALATIEGDTELAAALARIMRGMSWEFEEDLSKVVGDIPAHQLAETARKLKGEILSQSLNLAQMLSEYWQEEQPMIAKKRHIDVFNREVDDLREDTERLQKRIEKLYEKLGQDRGE